MMYICMYYNIYIHTYSSIFDEKSPHQCILRLIILWWFHGSSQQALVARRPGTARTPKIWRFLKVRVIQNWMVYWGY